MLRCGAVSGFFVSWLAMAALCAASAAHAGTSSLAQPGDGARLVVPNAPALNPTSAITIEAWVRPTSRPGAVTIAGKDYVEGWWLGLTSAGRIRYYANGATTSADGALALPLGRWSHVAVTFDGTTRRYYANGRLDHAAATPLRLPITSADLGIGAEADGSFPFAGSLAELRVWSRARSEAEIRRDLVRQLAGTEEGLVGLWRLEGGPGEALGRLDATAQGAASFAGPAAPPEPHAPLRIPRLGDAPTVDGACATGEYTHVRVPVWSPTTDPASVPAWVSLAATADELFLCFERLPRGSLASPSFAAAMLDRDGDATASPEPGQDLRAGIDEDGDPFVQTGSLVTDWTAASAGVAALVRAARTLGEFDWSAELAIDRSLLPSAAPFGLAAEQRRVVAPSDAAAWPLDADDIEPASWEPVQIDDAIVPVADAANPTLTIAPVVGAFDAATDRAPIRIHAHARDDVDVATVEIWLDHALVRVCDFPGPGDTLATCSFEGSSTLGPHVAFAFVYDHRGRIGSTHTEGFRVTADGAAPELDVTHAPSRPAVGGVATVTATARDAVGVRSIDVVLDAPPWSRHCEFAIGTTEAVCSVAVPLPAARPWVHYAAVAEDFEDFSARDAGAWVVAAALPGEDADGDGLPAAFERAICTRDASQDSDADSLPDDWEILGLVTNTGARVDLPRLGANPCRKDVFVQHDYEAGADFEPGVIGDLVAAFRAHGIEAHFERHERPRGPAPRSAHWASYQRDDAGRYWLPPEYNWTHIYLFSRHQGGRSGAYDRYFDFDIYFSGTAVTDCCPLDDPDPQASCGRATGADTCPLRESRAGQANRLMHELGHTIGLGHGGQIGTPVPERVAGHFHYTGTSWDDGNYKPHHVSVMDYGYDGSNVCIAPGPGLSLVAQHGYLDRDRLALDESALDERPDGVLARDVLAEDCSHAAEGARPLLRFTCLDARESARPGESVARVLNLSDGTRRISRTPAGARASSTGLEDEPEGIDWDCDGAIEASVAGSVNGDGVRALPSEICDGLDDDANGVIDDQCGWVGGERLTAVGEWERIPRLPACIITWEDGADCYWQPRDYRDAITLRDTALDCRIYGGDGALPDVLCPGVPTSSEPGSPDAEERSALALPDAEYCDGTSNDGDLEVDEGCRDGDADGVADVIDVCPATPDADQRDGDGDGVGDACADLAAPPQLRVEDGPNGRLIRWDASGPDVLGYAVYRENLADGSLEYLGDGWPSTASLAIPDVGVGADVPVRYRVVPVDRAGREDAFAAALVPAPEPGALAASLAALGALIASRASARRRRLR